jgi:hypothetical protein
MPVSAGRINPIAVAAWVADGVETTGRKPQEACNRRWSHIYFIAENAVGTSNWLTMLPTI